LEYGQSHGRRHYFQIDLGSSNDITQIVMDSNGSADYARAYTVYVTDDTGNLGTPVATGTATATPSTVPCTPKTGRFIRVVLGAVPAGVTSWWSIQEFNAYGSLGNGGGAGARPIAPRSADRLRSWKRAPRAARCY
jgi:F5/8 type C domain